MQLTPGAYRFVPARSRAAVIAHAPGHKFRAEGAGVEGTVELDETRLLRASATFGLAALDAGDPLGNHELRKFLGGEKLVRAEIASPVAVAGGVGEVVVTIGARSMRAAVRISGTPAAAGATFALSFTGLGWSPPKLLFLRVKDTLDIEISAHLESCRLTAE